MSDWVYQLWIRGREHGSMRPYSPTFDAFRPYFLTLPDKWPWEAEPSVALIVEGPKAIVKVPNE